MSSPETEQFLVSTKELGEILGVSRTSVAAYAKKGMPRHQRGQYDLKAVLQWFLADKHLDGSSEEMRRDLMRAQRDKHDLDIEIARRKLCPSAEAHRALADVTNIALDGLSALPGRMCNQLAALDSPAHIERAMRDEIGAIRGLVAASIREFESEYQDGGGDVEPAAPGARRPVGRPKKDTNRASRARSVAK